MYVALNPLESSQLGFGIQLTWELEKTTYDPNWREFIGTQLVQIVEEFSDLLGDSLVSRIEDSLEIAAVGSMRRNGSYPEGDNLTPAYSNPAIMRAWYVSWIGQRRNNQVCDPA
jgi:hypothetical protein